MEKQINVYTFNETNISVNCVSTNVYRIWFLSACTVTCEGIMDNIFANKHKTFQWLNVTMNIMLGECAHRVAAVALSSKCVSSRINKL
jgi:hypothetical protein